MKQIITAAALVWFALAAPGAAEAFTLGVQGTQVEITIGASQSSWFGGQRHNNNRQQFNRRFPGFGHNDQRFRGWGNYGGGSYGRGYSSHGYQGGGYQGGGYQGGGYRLPVHAILRSLRANQYRHISFPRYSRGLYHARALNSHGRWVRLAIDPYSGRIVRLRFRF